MMRKTCKVTVNGQSFAANCGELLLDGAIMNGVELPHDCRTGICGSCRVRLVEGKVFGGDEDGSGMIHACQARIVSDLSVETEPVPDSVTVSAEVARLVRLAPDVVGVELALEQPFHYLPGQYCNLQFRGFPVRSYSPSYPLEGAPDERRLHFHIRKLADGAVSSALGERIRVGHRVKLSGPFGSAYFRPDHSGCTVLVSSGTGFAPMWSIAVAAITEQPERELIFVVGARRLASFYMHAALCRLALFPNVTIIPVVSEPQAVSSAIRVGQLADQLPKLSADDVVYVSGAPALTQLVARMAKTASARCYTDPFVASAKPGEQGKLLSRLIGWLDSGRGNAAPPLQPEETPARPLPRKPVARVA
jgi:NAD(P)H-flavin reductase